MSATKLNIPIQKNLIVPSLHFIEQWAMESSIPANTLENLIFSAGTVLNMIVSQSYSHEESGELVIELDKTEKEILVKITNSGQPLYPSDFPEIADVNGLEALRQKRNLTRLEFQNLGRAGQSMTFGINVVTRKKKNHTN